MTDPGPRRASFRVDVPLHLARTLGPHGAVFGDPTQRASADEALRATRTPEGPAALYLRLGPGRLAAQAWGPGAEWALERVPDLAGLTLPLPEPEAVPALLRPFARRARGLRLARTHRVVELLARVILQQKISGKEAGRAWRLLVREVSEPAPGPLGRGLGAWDGLWLPPAAEALAALDPALFPPLGIPPRQGETLRRVGAHARALEAAAAMAPSAAEARLRAIPGVGVWTARLALLLGLGGVDAVPLGDWGLPDQVAWNLSGGAEPRADDARLLELLAPFQGYRGVALRWIVAGGGMPPRRMPREAMRPLAPWPADLAARRRRRTAPAPGSS